MNIEQILSTTQYTISHELKCEQLLPILKERIKAHMKYSVEIYNIIKSLNLDIDSIDCFENLPFIPVRLFKEMELKSIDEKDIFKVLTSSGTTSQVVSKIFLDRHTALMQTKALASIITSFIGINRLPMLIIDTQSVLKDKNQFSARGAGILGLSNFGRNHFYALDEEMNMDISALNLFLKKHSGQEILIFGFTFMIWSYFLDVLEKSGQNLSIDGGILIHSGGWKKLIDLKITNIEYKEKIKNIIGLDRVHNFYGMVEQVGGVYMECENGYFHTSNFTDVIVRSFDNWLPLPNNNEGLIQTISILPSSYPGNSILTEDLGTIHGVDDCECGRLGKYFSISGRIPAAELRGCSDTHAYSN
jgi:hypothetical protein